MIEARSIPSFATALVTRRATLSAQMRKAADWIAQHPQDVALLSMREQARRAGVQPATMTRLAQALGHDGYDGLRAEHHAALRLAGMGLSAQAMGRLPLDADSAQGAAGSILRHGAAQIAGLSQPQMLEDLVQAAALVRSARRIFCLGLRSSHSVAWHLQYALSLLGLDVRLLDMAGGIGLDALAQAGTDDVLCVCGVAPYTRLVVEASLQARDQGLRSVAITDSPLSPLAAGAHVALIAPTASASFLHAMAPAFVLADTLAALVGRGDDPALLARLQGLDQQLAARNTFFAHSPGKGSALADPDSPAMTEASE